MQPFRLLFVFIALSCGAERDPSSLFGPNESGILVVDATLIVDQAMPPLYLRQTLSPNGMYTESMAAVSGAEVIISQGTAIYPYTEDSATPGRYLPPGDPPVITSQTEYKLLIRYAGNEARATTTTPDRISIDEVVLLDGATLDDVHRLTTYRDTPPDVFGAPENQVVYQEFLLEVRFDRVDVQAYQVGIFSLDPASDFVIVADFLEEEDFEDFERESSSPPLEVADGRLRLPWFAIAFAGRHHLKVFAMDDNWYDFARSSPELQTGGFGGLAGDSFDRPIFRLDGAIGLFGSASVDSLGFVVLPRETTRNPQSKTLMR